jgi:hypothetical protein
MIQWVRLTSLTIHEESVSESFHQLEAYLVGHRCLSPVNFPTNEKATDPVTIKTSHRLDVNSHAID